MARYRGPKNRIARRFQTNVFGRARNPLLHKVNPPGMHGARRRKKSDYGLQFEEKQKLKAVYGMLSEKQLIRYYREAVRRRGNTAHLFIEMLESRLDIVVYRLKMAPTIFAAHQLVSHGHILVDGKKVDRRSFHVRQGMKISVREKSQTNQMIRASIESGRDLPEYCSVDPSSFTGELSAPPAYDMVPMPLIINVPVVCELLAHTT